MNATDSPSARDASAASPTRSTVAAYCGVIGLVFQIISSIGLLIEGFRFFFGSTDQSIARAAGAIIEMIKVTGLLAGIGLIGLLLLWIAVVKRRLRTRWIYRVGTLAVLPWLVLFPIGTLIVIAAIAYARKHRAEFLTGR